MNNFDLKKFLTENKLTSNSKVLSEALNKKIKNKDFDINKEEVSVNENLAITQKMLEKAMEKDPKFEEKVYKAVEDAKRGKTNDLRDITNYLSSLKIDEEVSDGEVSDEEIKNIEDTLKKINESQDIEEGQYRIN